MNTPQRIDDAEPQTIHVPVGDQFDVPSTNVEINQYVLDWAGRFEGSTDTIATELTKMTMEELYHTRLALIDGTILTLLIKNNAVDFRLIHNLNSKIRVPGIYYMINGLYFAYFQNASRLASLCTTPTKFKNMIIKVSRPLFDVY